MRTVLLCISLLACSIGLKAQGIVNILEQIESNNLSLKSQKARIEAIGEQLRSELGLSDLELEYSHLWGPEGIGRNDISISQTFDFATLSGAKRKSAESEFGLLKYEYLLSKRELLLRSRNLCSQIIYYNARIADLQQAAALCERLEKAYKLGLEAGEFSKIDYHKAALQLIEAQTELELSISERESLLAELCLLNGGKSLELSLTKQPFEYLPGDFDSWLSSAQSKSSALAAYSQKITLSEQQLKLSKASALPSFSLGYAAELVPGSNFRGVSLGLSIPLWSAGRKISASRKAVEAAQAEYEEGVNEFRIKALSLYNKAKLLSGKLEQLSDITHDADLLSEMNTALEAGQMSLIEYITELSLYYDARELEFNTQLNYCLTINELLYLNY